MGSVCDGIEGRIVGVVVFVNKFYFIFSGSGYGSRFEEWKCRVGCLNGIFDFYVEVRFESFFVFMCLFDIFFEDYGLFNYLFCCDDVNGGFDVIEYCIFKDFCF